MSHRFRKPKPISKASRAAVGANPAVPVAGLAAGALVLTTESKEKYEALAAAYRDEYKPQGQTENDLVEELTAAKWLQRRYNTMITALIDVSMDRMEKEIYPGVRKNRQRPPEQPSRSPAKRTVRLPFPCSTATPPGTPAITTARSTS
jgi:hypothetical protein